eukprot:CAMPEP_0113455676 /NCGR_PEP_ID=MMETSP0014_2-20120614/8496_1 /TAXON_ID=2857 /ORGANISM="Nitzschia sp." /LENGTH=349 /DNA_ID=CAMNT_0000347109 /DNA_START=609 /DNA_END=1658 /DNA_ORIENTATION=+ /assembly_acc=CAM_ASM_000159
MTTNTAPATEPATTQDILSAATDVVNHHDSGHHTAPDSSAGLTTTTTTRRGAICSDHDSDEHSTSDEPDQRRRKLSPKSDLYHEEEEEEHDDGHDDHDQEELNDIDVADILEECGFALMPSQVDGTTTTTTTETIEASTVPLPDPTIPNVSPENFLLQLIEATCPRLRKSPVSVQKAKSPKLQPFWTQTTDEQVAAYTVQIVSACRTNSLESLRALQQAGHRLDCFNRFGESLLTMACRRGFEDIVKYLLEDESVSTETLLRSCDDTGRTVLHDACWNPTPQLNICQWIMEREPALWLVADNRGCSPFQYARPEHWDVWRQFLMDNRQHLQSLQNDADVAMYFAGGTSS